VSKYDGTRPGRRLWVLPTVAALALVAGGAAYLVSPSGEDGSAPSSAAAAEQPQPVADVDEPAPAPAAATVTAPPVTETVTPKPRVVVKWREKRVPVPGPTVRVPVPGPTVTLPPKVVRVRVPVPGPIVTLPPKVVRVPADPEDVLPVPPPTAQEPPAEQEPQPEPEPTADPQTGTDEPTDAPPAEDAPEPTPPATDEPEPMPAAAPAVFRAASYNVLGASHTAPGGTRPSWASGTTRVRWALYLLRRHRVDLVGLQELQDPQHAAFLRRPGWEVWPTSGHTDNAVAWRPGVFRLVDATRVPIPYFRGREVRMPVVLLEHRATGQRTWVGSFHNPASLPWLPSQGAHRDEAQRRQARLAARLDDAHPVLVTGDMNDSRDYYCPFVRATGYVAANGGGVDEGRCTPPGNAGIDWIFGSPGTAFTRYRAVHGPLAARTSDHPLIVTTTRIGG
jgi:endonuclease/exonuclease/phosphatase family metal-dependent hydrolase